jgi:carboxypeptidase C (cathepsin A)
MPVETKAEAKITRQDTPPSVYRAPKGVETSLVWKGAGRTRVRATADWLVLRESGVPTSEVFFVSYRKDPAEARRPITFLFNGGPGAASAFLHMGTAGPRRILFGNAGAAMPPPVQLADNAESWLKFTDLVFVDPVGTGFSRTVSESKLEQQGVDAEDEKREKKSKELPEAKKGFFKVKRDIEVLSEFVTAFLSREKRWESPVCIAGESYGGFRVGKLVRSLPERGVGVCAAVMVSPAIDFLTLVGSDYDILPWIGTVPTMSLAARLHGMSRGRFASMRPDAVRAAAEEFAQNKLAPMLLRGSRTSDAERRSVLRTHAELVGLPEDLVARYGGRLPIEVFTRELLREKSLVCGLYDAAVTGPNVFPDREGVPNPDPTLAGITASFTAGINVMLRSEIGLSCDREYHLVSEEVWKDWADDRMSGYWARQLECADDLRYGMAINPRLRLLVAHGWYDLVTTYYSSAQTISMLRLPGSLAPNVRLQNYDGGHMFYSWDASRKAFGRDVAALFGAAAKPE